MQGFNRYSYCLNNPLKYVDPSGERWTDVIDDYFNQYGKYLGSDLAETDNIRIIKQETWDKYGANISYTGKDGSTIISSDAANIISRVVSESNLSDINALNIYKHYNSGDYKSDYKLVSDNGDFNMQTQQRSETIAINLAKNKQQKISDHFNEIKNLFSHENQHVLDFKSNFKGNINEWEQRAVKTQMTDPTFPNTRSVFQESVKKYGIKFGMIF